MGALVSFEKLGFTWVKSQLPAAAASFVTTLSVSTYLLLRGKENPLKDRVVQLGSHVRDTALSAGLFAQNYVITTFVVGTLSYLTKYAPNIQIPSFQFGNIGFGDFTFEEVRLPKVESSLFAETLGVLFDKLALKGASSVFIVGSTMVAIYALYKTTGAVFDHLQKPVLTRKYKFDDWSANIYDYVTFPWRKITQTINHFLFNQPQVDKKVSPIFNSRLAQQLDELAQGLKNIHQNEGLFSNALFFGPPGTGKTMTAEYIATEMGFNYVEISGGDIAKFIGSKQHPLSELDRIFKRIHQSKTPTVLFIDEMDAVGLDRSKLDPPRIEILNALLNKTGTPSKKLILIAATNRPEDLDPALKNRFEDQLYMGPPELKERSKIIKLYSDYLFDNTFDKALFDESFIQRLSEKLEGQVPRTIYKLLNKCLHRKNYHGHSQLTRSLVLETIEQYFENQKMMPESSAQKS